MSLVIIYLFIHLAPMQILIVGDKFYNSCVAVLKAGNRFVNPMLLVDELQRQLEIEDKEIRLEIEDCLVNGIINARDDNDIPNLRKVMSTVFFNQVVHFYRFVSIAGFRRILQG